MAGFRVRAAREEDIEQLVEMGLAAYPESEGFAQRKRNLVHNSFGNLSDVRVIEKDGRLAGQATLFSIELWLGGKRISAGGIASVAVTPSERREGVSHVLLEQLHAEVHARRMALTMLYPFREGFYARIGYATTVPLVTLRVACDSLAHAPCLADGLSGFTIRSLQGQLVADARALYDERGPSYAGRVVRSEAGWLALFAKEARHWMGVVSAEGRLEGYVCFSYEVPVLHGRQTLVVHELTARDANAKRALLLALSKQRDQVDDVDITVPLGDPLPFAFRDAPGARRGTAAVEHPLGVLGAGPMVRLVDTARALSSRGYSNDGELHIALTDAAPNAPKGFRLVTRDGAGEVAVDAPAKASAPPPPGIASIQLSPPTLASIVAAGMRPSDAAELGLLRGEAVAVRLADAMFAGPRFQCLDPF